MNNNSGSTEQQLTELCITLIDRLNALKEDGVISEEEYIKHTEIKKEFLDYVRNRCNKNRKNLNLDNSTGSRMHA
ncbi:MAG: hypothetical protein PWR27_2357 [Petroclostridium sp.]|jgi:uncharacterized protein (UPF0305 family)|nr:hypothetical protein [Clostridia bacterium]MDK2811648.1 hypothetical protein [Petroclostridium sp.]